MRDIIDNDLKQAMLAKDTLTMEVLRDVKTAFQAHLTSKNAKPLDNSVAYVIIGKLVKQREDSIKMFKEGGRIDLVNKQEIEKNILNSYLPEKLSGQELNLLVKGIAANMQDPTIGELIKKVKEQVVLMDYTVDGKELSEIIKQII